MRKFVIYIGLLLVSLAACQEKDILEYSLEKDGLQFYYDTNRMRLDYKYIEQFRVDTVWQWGSPYPYRHYFGDSLLRDTLSLYVTVMGRKELEDREFKMKAVLLEGQDPATLAPVEFQPSYRFRAGHLVDTIHFVLVLPEKRGNFAAGLTFDIDDNDPLFESGALEKKVYTLRVSNRYPKPDSWDVNIDYLGEYTEEKYAFMVTMLGELYDEREDWSVLNEVLREMLEEYNDAYPDDQKDFTFPVYTKPGWWESSASASLGEFSEAKKAFVISVVGQGNYNSGNWFDWASVNVQLRAEYDAWNAAHPDDPLPFSQFPVNTKPGWWDGCSSDLGEFSEAKKDFIISVVGEDNFNFMTYWPGYMSMLRTAYDKYNAENPGNPLPFPPFPESGNSDK